MRKLSSEAVFLFNLLLQLNREIHELIGREALHAGGIATELRRVGERVLFRNGAERIGRRKLLLLQEPEASAKARGTGVADKSANSRFERFGA